MGYILSIDQGTTGTTSVLIDSKNFDLIGKINKEYPQIYPHPGWVEHNLTDIWSTVESTVKDILNKFNISGNDIECIGITNQRETTCAFDNKGKPLANAIVWQDRRTAEYCDNKKEQGYEETVKKKTGLPIDPYFSGTKMNWLLNNNSDVKLASENNNLKFGTIDTFLLYKLTDGHSYMTEASNASRTLLMNLLSCDWDEELLNIFEINKDFLPQISDSFCDFGSTSGLNFLPDGIPITGILGDQQAALFGQAGYSAGDLKCTYGTGAFLLLNTGEEIKYSQNGLLTTVAYKQNSKPIYALEGSCYIAGAAVQWLRDNLNIIDSSKEIEKLALEVKDLKEMEHVLFMPFFTGLGSPHWESTAKAAIIGITRDTSSPHLSRACLDGIALSINDLITAMKDDTKLEIPELKVDGGACLNNLLMTIQATISNLEIIRPKIIETTAYGAALAAALGKNLLKIEDIKKLWTKDNSFNENKNELDFYKNKKNQWNHSIKKLFLS